MIPDFIRDYLTYNLGNECPKNYHILSAHIILAATLGHHVYADRGYYTLFPSIYGSLIGDQGSRKTAAMDIARDVFMDANPNASTAANVQSREDWMKLMSGDDTLRVFTNENGAEVESHPMTFFLSEFSNFVSINPGNWILLLTEIYDRKVFKNSTLKHGEQIILHPCVNILACDTHDGLMKLVKHQVVTGGFSRRMVYVLEEVTERISFPRPTDEGKAARERCVEHLKKVKLLRGKFTWTSEAETWFDKWYLSLVYPDTPMLRGYYSSKHDLLLKFAMGLCASEREPKLLFTAECFQLALDTLNAFEANMKKLFAGAGRNELAVPQQRMLDMIAKNGGWMPAKQWRMKSLVDMDTGEIYNTERFLRENQQIYFGNAQNNGCVREMVCLPNKFFEEFTTQNGITKPKEKTKPNA